MDNIQKSYLVETARWQKVIGILMAVGTCFLALAAILFIGFGLFAPDTIASASQPAAYFITMGIVKKWEPLLLVPIGFGMIVGNIPAFPGMNISIYEEGSVLKAILDGFISVGVVRNIG